MRSRPPSNPLDELVGYTLRRVSAAGMESLARDLATLELRTVEASALLLVEANPLIKPIELGRELGMQRANVTPLLALLVERGLVQRRAIDGRSHGLILSAAGEETARNAFALMAKHDERMLDPLEPHQVLQLRALLRLLRDERR